MRCARATSIGAMQEQLSDLGEALDEGDGTTARTALQGVPATDEAVLQELALRAAAGSDVATELLLERLDDSGVVRRFARAALFDDAAIDDVSQDTLISVASSIGSFRGDAKITTWVHRIVRNRVVDHLRRQRATAPLPPDDLAPAARISSMIATRATVREVLASLPELYREPVVLRDLEGLPYAEIAERLDRSLGTVKSQIARGRAMVASGVGDPREDV